MNENRYHIKTRLSTVFKNSLTLKMKKQIRLLKLLFRDIFLLSKKYQFHNFSLTKYLSILEA